MGYRVGLQCFDSKEIAHDFVLSAVSPVLLPDGSLVRPEKKGQHWYYQEVKIDLSFPECSNLNQIYKGMSVGASFVSLFVLIVGFRVFYRMIYKIGGQNDS